MIRQTTVEILVGIFMVLAFAAFLTLAFKVSGLTALSYQPTYQIEADFDNVGDLKERAPVTIAGVRIGEVKKITLDANTFKAKVFLQISADKNKIPMDSSARILTEGLLGSNYVGLSLGFSEDKFLTNGSVIQDTHPALVLEDIIGQLMFSLSGDSKKSKN